MSPSLTKYEAAALGRRAERPQKAPGELIAVWVPGKLINGKNASMGWQLKAWGRYKREWREAVALALMESGWTRMVYGQVIPKRVVFHARTWAATDGDGLQLSLAPVRDALIECGVVSGDADRDGHVWEYHQAIDRARRGVEIHVSLLA
jgi:hypothetical protein